MTGIEFWLEIILPFFFLKAVLFLWLTTYPTGRNGD